MLTAIGKRIQQVRTQYANIMRLSKNGSCYSRYCNMTAPPGKPTATAQSLTSTCYSPICLQKARIKRDLITLLRKANSLSNNQSVPSLAPFSALSSSSSQQSKIGLKQEASDEAKDAIRRDLESAVAMATHCAEEFQTTNIDVNKISTAALVSDGPLQPAKRIKLETPVADEKMEVGCLTESFVKFQVKYSQ